MQPPGTVDRVFSPPHLQMCSSVGLFGNVFGIAEISISPRLQYVPRSGNWVPRLRGEAVSGLP
jgi:hypothetical protein